MRPSRPLCLVALVAFLVGGSLRLRGIAERPLYGDEHHTVLLADRPYRVILGTFDETGSHVALPLLQAVALDLFGPGPATFRLPALVPGLLLLLLAPLLLRAFVGWGPAVVATAALAVSPMEVFYAGFARAYALAALLSLGLARTVLAATGREGSRRAWVGCAVLGALTPYVHLSTAGLVAALGGTALALALRRPAPGSPWLRIRPAALAFGAALVGLVGLYAPLWSQVHHYLFEVQPVKAHPRSAVGVAAVLLGGRIPAAVVLAGVLAALPGLVRTRPRALAVGGAAVLGPLVALLATRPHGMEYAWARYLLGGLPLLYATAAFGLWSLAERLWGRRGPAVGLGLGCALVGLGWWAGPLGPRRPPDFPFDRTYLALYALAPFDEPWPEASELYARLRADPEVQTILEVPPIYTRAVLLYRHHCLRHGKSVRLGFPGELPRALRGGPYRRLSELETDDADWVVVHRTPAAEVRAYFRYVYGELVPDPPPYGEAGLYERQRSTFVSSLIDPETMGDLAAALRNRWGPATYKDAHVLAWKLER